MPSLCLIWTVFFTDIRLEKSAIIQWETFKVTFKRRIGLSQSSVSMVTTGDIVVTHGVSVCFVKSILSFTIYIH